MIDEIQTMSEDQLIYFIDEMMQKQHITKSICECGNELKNVPCQTCGCKSSTIDIDYDLYDENKKIKYVFRHCFARYLLKLLFELKYLSSYNYEANEMIDNLPQSITSDLHRFKKFIYKHQPKLKSVYRHIFAKKNGLWFDPNFISLYSIIEISKQYKTFKNENYFPNRIMYIYIFHRKIYDYFKDVLELLVANEKYLKYLPPSNF